MILIMFVIILSLYLNNIIVFDIFIPVVIAVVGGGGDFMTKVY